MNWKHYLAILVPYLVAAGVAIVAVASHSTNAHVADVATFILAMVNHNSVLMAPPEKAK